MPNLNGNRAFAVSPNEPLAATSIRSNVVVWDLNTGEELNRLGHDNEVWVVAFSPDGRLLATVDSKAVMVREARTSREIARLTHPQIVDAIAFSPDGLYLAAGSRDYMARVWEVDSGRMVEGTPLIHTEDVIALSFSDDGQYLITISRDDILWVWEVRSGRQIGQTSYGSWEDTTVSFTPDGRFLTAADLYENSAESPDDRIVVNMHQNGGAAISPDLRYLARIDGQSNAVRVLEVDSGREIIRMPHELELIAVTFSSDGKYLITATFSDSMAISTILAQRRLWVWLWQPEDLIREACARLTRNLTQAEWEQYMVSLPYRDTC
jgi:WD40 repeat protein